ncbi:hypothetical protein KSP39_PZI011496 [Platanthera zijinensis]|uniref:Uncharacterized protein n=1 Tax=Platanthera zijinensis TaxID=2320716 RepID=A0AAP0G5F9_9ASPA
MTEKGASNRSSKEERRVCVAGIRAMGGGNRESNISKLGFLLRTVGVGAMERKRSRRASQSEAAVLPHTTLASATISSLSTAVAGVIMSQEDVLTRAAALGRGAATTGIKRFKCNKKRTRGPTIGLEWSKRRQNNLERVAVQLPAELRRLVGYRAQELITKIGRYVRQNAPLNVEKWSEIPTDIIDKIINIINAKFNLPKESHVHGDLISSLRRHYNVWRFRLHADYYLKWNTDAQRRANGPKDIDPSQWNWIINYWGSARFKRISEINKQNRSQQKIKSHVGSKTIARTVYEMRIAPNEQDELPLYIRLWEKTHKGKHNEWQDETVKESYNTLLDLHDTQMREKGEDKLTPEEAYTTVLGHRSGYIPGMGPGPKPSERKNINGIWRFRLHSETLAYFSASSSSSEGAAGEMET